MLMADQGQSLLLDPTIGLIVKGVTYDGLVGGTKYTTFSSFYSRTDISSFDALVLDAVTMLACACKTAMDRSAWCLQTGSPPCVASRSRYLPPVRRSRLWADLFRRPFNASRR